MGHTFVLTSSLTNTTHDKILIHTLTHTHIMVSEVFEKKTAIINLNKNVDKMEFLPPPKLLNFNQKYLSEKMNSICFRLNRKESQTASKIRDIFSRFPFNSHEDKTDLQIILDKFNTCCEPRKNPTFL